MTGVYLQRLSDAFDARETEIRSLVEEAKNDLILTVLRLDAKTNTRNESKTSRSSMEEESGKSCRRTHQEGDP